MAIESLTNWGFENDFVSFQDGDNRLSYGSDRLDSLNNREKKKNFRVDGRLCLGVVEERGGRVEFF